MGGGTTTMSGTSMAAPHLGGGAALYLSWNTSASPSAVESTLKTSAWDPSSWGPSYLSKDGRSILQEYVGGF
jgi:subtilisin family serine protease